MQINLLLRSAYSYLCTVEYPLAMEDDLEKYLRFIREVERLKSVERTAWTTSGRRESTAEHSWRLALLAAVLTGERPELDMQRVVLMCLIHDLGEAFDGDVPAIAQTAPGVKAASELAAMERYTQAAKTYEQTVLTAFADVEKALVAIATYRTQTERSCELVVSNDRIATMTQALYRSGLSDYLDVIDAQRSLYQSQMEFVNLVAQQYINYVNLCKALGGGW